MNTTLEEKLAEYWLMPTAELRQRIDILTRIEDLRLQLRATAESPKQSSHPPVSPPASSRGLTQRKPMRAPKEGSLRAAIQSALRNCGKPMARADIIDTVAKARGVTVTAKLRAKVGGTLTNPHDPFFARVGRGVYTLREGA